MIDRSFFHSFQSILLPLFRLIVSPFPRNVALKFALILNRVAEKSRLRQQFRTGAHLLHASVLQRNDKVRLHQGADAV